MPPNPRKLLYDLFVKICDEANLRRLIEFLEPKLARDLPGPGTPLSGLAFDAAGVLERHGYIDQDLFNALWDNFPKRKAEIDVVAKALGYAPKPAPTPSVETPQQPRATRDRPGNTLPLQRISFFASNPQTTSQLALDEEQRAIKLALRGAKYRDAFRFQTHWAVRADDLRHALLDDEPVIVHFSGHGEGDQGIILHSDNAARQAHLHAAALAGLFRVLKQNIRLVVLNACYSEVQAQAIVQEIDVVVGMSSAIGDEAARVFAGAFYCGLAFGKSVQVAFDLGVNALQISGIDETSTPKLLTRPGVDASKVVLVDVNKLYEQDFGTAKAEQTIEPQPGGVVTMPPKQAASKPRVVPPSQAARPAFNSPQLRKLTQAYASGQLIAFVGSGVSRAVGLPTWGELIDKICEYAPSYGTPAATLTEIADLSSRGKFIEAITALEHTLGKPTFVSIVQELLDDRNCEVPPLAQLLAKMAPKLRAVLTTNLDRLVERAFPGSWVTHNRPLPTLARERDFILKLHGTLHDADTWIMTRPQYDRAMYADPRHQPVFRALLLGAPMLFVGFGLDDADLNAVLGQIRAMGQGQVPQHFALVPEPIGPVRRRQMSDAGVTLVGYDNSDGTHSGAVETLRALAQSVK